MYGMDGPPGTLSRSASEHLKGMTKPSRALKRARASASKSAKSAGRRMLLKKASSSNGLRRSSVGPTRTRHGRGAVITGFMFKKRTGVTGLAASLFVQSSSERHDRAFGGRLWILRYFVLDNGVMYYYDIPKDKSHAAEKVLAVAMEGGDEEEKLQDLGFDPEPGTERGSMDLSRHGVHVKLAYGHDSHMGVVLNTPNSATSPGNNEASYRSEEGSVSSSGGSGGSEGPQSGPPTPPSPPTPTPPPEEFRDQRSPSPFQFEVVGGSSLNHETWTVCTFNKRSLFRWLEALTVAIYAPRGPHGELLLDEEPFLDDEVASSSSTGDESNGDLLLPSDPQAAQSTSANKISPQVVRSPQAQAAAQSPKGEGFLQGLKEMIKTYTLELVVAACASLLSLVGSGDIDPKWGLICLTVVLLRVIFIVRDLKVSMEANGPLKNSTNTSNEEPDMVVAATTAATAAAAAVVSNSHLVSSGASGTQRPVPLELVGKRLSSTSIISSTSSESAVQSEPTLTKRRGGESVAYTTQEAVDTKGHRHCWIDADDSAVKVRAGPNYKSNKKKQATKPSLFRTIGIDVLEWEHKVDHIANCVELPFDKCVPKGTVPDPFPRLLIINYQIPKPSHGFSFTSSSDPKYYSFVMYTTPTQDLIDMLTGKKDEEACVPLLRRWITEAPQNVALKERLKLIGTILNPDDCGMPGWTQGYNGKPVMIRKSGKIIRGEGYLEIDVDFRMWGFLTRKGINALLPNAVAKMQFVLSLVIQGEEDEELPERTMISGQLAHIDAATAPSLYI